MRVLLIDDDEMVLETLAPGLSDAGFEVETAQDGEIAADRFKRISPDVVVTDIIMPNREGIETLIEFKKIAPDIPIIVMSGGGRTHKLDFLDVAEKMGAAATLRKPFLPDDLANLIRSVLSDRQLSNDRQNALDSNHGQKIGV